MLLWISSARKNADLAKMYQKLQKNTVAFDVESIWLQNVGSSGLYFVELSWEFQSQGLLGELEGLMDGGC